MKPLVLLFFAIIFLTTACQQDEMPIDETFDRVISNTLFDQNDFQLASFVLNNDQSIIVAYNGIEAEDLATDNIIDSPFIHLQKISTFGKEIWTKTYSTRTPSEIFDIIKSNDGGYLLSGMIDSLNNQPGFNHNNRNLILKIDAQGELVWQKDDYFGINRSSYEIVQQRNGTIAIVTNREIVEYNQGGMFTRKTPIPFNQISAGWVNAISSNEESLVVAGNRMIAYENGMSTWNFVYSEDETIRSSSLSSSCPIVPEKGSGFLAFGHRSFQPKVPGNYPTDFLLTRVDEEGNILWEKTFDNEYRDYGLDINPTPDGHFVAVGKTIAGVHDFTGYIRIYKFDIDGNILWTDRKYPELSFDHIYPSNVKQIDDSHVVLMYSQLKITEPQAITEIKLSKIKMD